MSKSKECNVCAEKYNLVLRKEIKCVSCNFECCRTCIETYLKNSNEDNHCMNCKHLWDDEFMKKSLTQASVKRLLEHRRDILFDREKAKLPYSQQYYVYHQKIKKDTELLCELHKNQLLIRDQISEYKLSSYAMLKDLNITKNCTNNEYIVDTLKKTKTHIEQCQKEDREFNKQMNSIRRKIYDWEHGQNALFEKKTDKENVITILKNCDKDDCKGFVMSDYKCGTCESVYCRKCNIIKEKDHECKEDDIKTAEFLKKSTKPCPTCAILIHKVSGCTQMWCPSCKTTFDYKTGKIDEGIIHNPHYFEWIRNNKNSTVVQENQENANCNRRVNQQQYLTHIRVAFSADRTMVRLLGEYNRLYGHTTYIKNSLPRLKQDQNKVNMDLRIQWMCEEITTDYLKRTLVTREKKHRYNDRKRQVYDLTETVFNDIQHKILQINDHKAPELKECIKEFNTIIDYTNQCLEKIGNVYNYKTNHTMLLCHPKIN